MAATEVVARPRDHVADIGGLARAGVDEQALLRVPVLLVEHRGHGVGGSGQLRMIGDILRPVHHPPRCCEPSS